MFSQYVLCVYNVPYTPHLGSEMSPCLFTSNFDYLLLDLYCNDVEASHFLLNLERRTYNLFTP